MIYLVLLSIFVIANDVFYLVPSVHIKGVFNVVDIGNLIIFVSVAMLFIRSKHRNVMLNPVGIMVILYLLMVLMHASIASFNYDQSVISGVIKVRHQFYYLSYFVFLLALDTDEKVMKFMTYLGWLGLFLVIVSAVNYAGFTLFHEHKWAEGQGVRSGIKRAFVPGMNILALTFTWYLTRILFEKKFSLKHGIPWMIIIVGLIFRQTRGRILAATMAMCWMLYREKHIKMLVIVIGAGAILGGVISMVTKENVLLDSYTTAATDLINQEGTWVGRMQTIDIAWAEFKKHPFLGSGAIAIRQAGDKLSSEATRAAYQADLGYAHWLKNYGIMGVVWLLVVAYLVFKKSMRRRKLYSHDIIPRFTEYHFIHLAVSTLTINYLVKPEGIVVICLVAALASRILQDNPEHSVSGAVNDDEPKGEERRILFKKRV